MVGLDRAELTGSVRGLLANPWFGGVFLYGAALGPRPEVRALTAELQSSASAAEPWLIAVDEEGGRVQEWREPWVEAFPSPSLVGAEIARRGDPAPAFELGRRIGETLADGGINVNFAPVVDVLANPRNTVISDRAFGGEAQLVSRAAAAFVAGQRLAAVASCAKHFPGHGDTDADSHLELPVVRHDLETLRQRELVPFVAAIAAGVEMVMTAHVLYPELDAARPATLSPRIVEDLLRHQLGFAGVVVTDDLKMRGVRDLLDLEEAAIGALRAGCDLLLSATEHDRHLDLAAALERAARDGRVSEERLAQSEARLVALRRRLGRAT